MARRLKAVTPVWEDTDEPDSESDTVWVGLTVESKDFTVDMKPYIRRAEVMVNPNKANDYHVKMPIARKILAELGPKWTIEGDRIVQALPFKIAWLYKHPTKDKTNPTFDVLRSLSAYMPKAIYDLFKGVCIFNEGSRPFDLKSGWLYLGVPSHSTSAGETIRLDSTSIKPEVLSIVGPKTLANGISSPGGEMDFAIYAPQTIYLKMFASSEAHLGLLMFRAITQGAKLAMEYTGGNIPLNTWLKSAAEQLKGRRSGDVEDVKKKIATQEATLRDHVLKIKKAQAEIDEHKVMLAGLSEKVTPANILKMYPALTNVQNINRDDPTMTLIMTKDIVINGVNLGPYTISMRPETAELLITGRKTPEDMVHPNLYRKGKEWTWMISEDSQNKILENLAGGRLGEATNLIIENLLSLYEAKEEYSTRLTEIKAFQDKVVEVKRRGRPKKTVEVAPVTVAAGIEGDPIKA